MGGQRLHSRQIPSLLPMVPTSKVPCRRELVPQLVALGDTLTGVIRLRLADLASPQPATRYPTRLLQAREGTMDVNQVLNLLRQLLVGQLAVGGREAPWRRLLPCH